SLVDDRALREIYLRGFEIAVKKAQPWTIMLAYNKINGTYCTENSWLIENVLRGEWGFKGLTVSDWIATNDRVESLHCGLDLEMPGSGYANVRKIAKAFRKGELDENDLSVAAYKVAELVNKAEPVLKTPAPEFNYEADHDVARMAAEQCPVLLKNNGILPVNENQEIAIIGERALKPMYQGYGSAQINAYDVVSVTDAFAKTGKHTEYARGYDIKKPDEVDTALISEAVSKALKAQVALVFVSCSEVDVCEGADRKSLSLPQSQTALIEAVCAANPNTAVIVTSGSSIEMPWVDKPAAILQTYLLGEAQGQALYNILTGRVSPSGKLPESYPMSLSDTPCLDDYTTGKDNNLIYRESIYVGYRYYEKANVPVLFPFGYGLSYTKFDYSNLALSKSSMTPDDKVTLTFNITNSGAFNAAETAQVYVGLKDSLVYRAKKELKDFAKVYIPAGTAQTVTIELDRSAFEYYSPTLRAWVVEPGTYDIMVGASSADIRLTATIDIKSDEANGEIDYREATPKYWNADIKNVDEEDFVDIFGAYPSEFVGDKSDDRVSRDNCLDELWDTKVGSKINPYIEMMMGLFLENDPAMYAVVYNSMMTVPFKRFVAATHGAVSDTMIDAIVHLFNSGSILETLMVAAAGVPESILNLAEPAIRDLIEKKSRG
ncbi:MAG: glycoside hydrolase family 3 C-terminal domain-containing protein, partial [Clostridia bacterium]|nr:glycoside hydrolase family 3 C-terminal domain-containing protein [Clostridia bacterium]